MEKKASKTRSLIFYVLSGLSGLGGLGFLSANAKAAENTFDAKAKVDYTFSNTKANTKTSINGVEAKIDFGYKGPQVEIVNPISAVSSEGLEGDVLCELMPYARVSEEFMKGSGEATSGGSKIADFNVSDNSLEFLLGGCKGNTSSESDYWDVCLGGGYGNKSYNVDTSLKGDITNKFKKKVKGPVLGAEFTKAGENFLGYLRVVHGFFKSDIYNRAKGNDFDISEESKGLKLNKTTFDFGIKHSIGKRKLSAEASVERIAERDEDVTTNWDFNVSFYPVSYLGVSLGYSRVKSNIGDGAKTNIGKVGIVCPISYTFKRK